MLLLLYLPIQKLEKIWPKISQSIPIVPVISPKKCRLCRISIARKSPVTFWSKPSLTLNRLSLAFFNAWWCRALLTVTWLAEERVSFATFSRSAVYSSKWYFFSAERYFGSVPSGNFSSISFGMCAVSKFPWSILLAKTIILGFENESSYKQTLMHIIDFLVKSKE